MGCTCTHEEGSPEPRPVKTEPRPVKTEHHVLVNGKVSFRTFDKDRADTVVREVSLHRPHDTVELATVPPTDPAAPGGSNPPG